MKLPLLLLAVASLAGSSAEAKPWPRSVRDFPADGRGRFVSGTYEIRLRIPDDPKDQAAGGSGGPIVEIDLRDSKSGWHTVLITQSVGERILVPWHGRPQIECWGRVGGGSWARELYRYFGGKYHSVRIDEFEQVPRHDNKQAATAELPSGFHGKAPPAGDPTLYFVETRLPSE